MASETVSSQIQCPEAVAGVQDSMVTSLVMSTMLHLSYLSFLGKPHIFFWLNSKTFKTLCYFGSKIMFLQLNLTKLSHKSHLLKAAKKKMKIATPSTDIYK